MTLTAKQKFILISKKSRKFIQLVKKKNKKSGRNNTGQITVRGRGGGLKKQMRIIDFYRSVLNILGYIIRFEYDSNRNSLLLLVSYSIGILSYIIAIEKIYIGTSIINTNKKMFLRNRIGSSMPLRYINLKEKINCLESKINGGAIFLRASGSFGSILKKNIYFCFIKLKSGFIKKFNSYCIASIGSVLNFNFYLFKYKKAGLNRKKNFRPRVRGVAMNPVDHPYGGGEGKKSKRKICMSP
jgi:large subunit ribosomal protein L2